MADRVVSTKLKVDESDHKRGMAAAAAATKDVATAADKAAKDSGASFGKIPGEATAAGKGAASGFGSTIGQMGSEARNAASEAGSAFGKIPSEARSAGSEAASGFGSQIGKIGSDARSAANDAEAAFDQLPGAVKSSAGRAVDAAKGEFGKLPSLVDELSGSVGKLGAVGWAGAGLTLGALFMKGLNDAIDAQQITANLRANLGASEADAAKAGQAVGEVFRRGVADSMDEAATAVSAVTTKLVDLGRVGPEELEAVAAMAVNFAHAFDQDVTQSVRAAEQLLANNLAPNAEAAFDIMTRAMQVAGTASEDLLDTIIEYSEPLHSLGLDGEQAMSILIAAVQNGARNFDVAADAVKEFTIRAVDGSASTAEGFKILGLNAKDMADQIARGGPAAEGAFALILQKLREVHDPVQQEAAGVALFGTMWEDMGAKAILSMDPTISKLGDVAGASDRAGAALENGPRAKLEAIRREIEGGFSQAIGNAIGDLDQMGVKAEDVGRSVEEGLTNAFRTLINIGRDITDFSQGVIAWFDAIGLAIEAFQALASGNFGLAAQKHREMVDGFKVAGAEFRDSMTQDSTEVGNFATTVYDKFGGADEFGRAKARSLREGVVFDMTTMNQEGSTQVGQLRDNATTAAGQMQSNVSTSSGQMKANTVNAFAGMQAEGSFQATVLNRGASSEADAMQRAVTGSAETMNVNTVGSMGRMKVGGTYWAGQMNTEVSGHAADMQRKSQGSADQMATGLPAALGRAAQGMIREFGPARPGIGSVFRDVVIRAINPFIGGVNSVARLLGIAGLQFFPVPSFHSGGVVGERGGSTRDLMRQPPRQDEVLALLQRGETVIPRDGQLYAAEEGSDAFLPVGRMPGMGDGLGIIESVKRAVFGVLGRIASAIADVVKPAINRLISSGDAMKAGPLIGQKMAGGSASHMGRGALAWVDRLLAEVNKYLAPPIAGGPGAWQAMWAAVSHAVPGLRLISGFRQNAVTVTGNRSYHALGRAIDISPNWNAFNWIAKNYAATELIFTPAGIRQEWHGRPHIYSADIARQHYDHIHWAMRNGGIVTRPLNALVGEAGPEAVIPLNRPVPALTGLGGGGDIGGLRRELRAIRELLEGHGITINVNGAQSPVETALAVQARMRARKLG